MSDDPETARQIAELARDTRPLLVLDVDDVLIEFVQPLIRYLDSQDVELKLDTFRLHGNARERKTGAVLENERVSALIDAFFAAQTDWQPSVADAVETIADLSQHAEIVMLTAMAHRHRATRRRHLDALGFPYPLVTTEAAKGPAIAQLRGASERPVAFVDDLPRNLQSVRDAVADAHLFQLMAMPSLRALLPALPDGIHVVDEWKVAGPMIDRALGFRP